MKPVSLSLTAFGSYPGTEVIDFAPLAAMGLFVVTGPTGSGKTTLFDAMTYALYGTLPGDRPDDVRSHHADPATATIVELVFEVDGRRFRVQRTPGQDRPKRRGSGLVTVPPSAVLFEVTSSGDLPLSSAKRDVDERCADLVGLDAGQFERVVLLPQGKCAQFLVCRSDDRQALLQQLFGTHLFARATELVNGRANELRRRLAEHGHEGEIHRAHAVRITNELISELDRDLVDDERRAGGARSTPMLDDATDLMVIPGALDGLAVSIASGRAALTVLSEELAEASAAHARATSTAALWDQRAAMTLRLDRLSADRRSIETSRRRAAEATLAAPVVLAAAAVDQATVQRDQAIEHAGSARRRLGRILESLGIGEPGEALSDTAASLAVRETELRAVGRGLADLAQLDLAVARHYREAAEAADAVHRHEHRGEVLGAGMADVTSSIEHLEPLADGLVTARAAAEKASDLVDARTRMLDAERQAIAAVEGAAAAHRDLLSLTAEFVADAAPRLADALRPGEPCAVCGSTEHPRPAAPSSGRRVDLAQIDAARTRTSDADNRLTKLVERIDLIRLRLAEHATRALDELVHEQSHALDAVAVAVGASDALRLARGQERGIRAELDDLARLRPKLDRTMAEAANELQTVTAKASELRASLGDVTEGSVRELLAAARRAGDLLAATDTADRTVSAAAGALALAEHTLGERLDTSGFTDVCAAHDAAVPETALTAMIKEVRRWDRDHADVTATLHGLVEHQLPEDRPDVDALRSVAAERRTRHETASRRAVRVEQRVLDAREAIDRAAAVVAATAQETADLVVAERVAAVCTGRNRLNLALETWVLASELDRVTAAANVHLGRMTSGRYLLQRSEVGEDRRRRTGLDLLVFDADTGRSRVPATLSGGEQFQASLALALGLADVVSRGGSGAGKVFEALFIDEGFGTLDPQALDDAIDALHALHATGRMVAVITHVEALKQQLPVGIEVRRRSEGSGSVTVQP